MKTFGGHSSSRDNNFNLLRFGAALLVIVYHSFVLAHGKGAVDPFTKIVGTSPGQVGVLIFFSISGYLITMSYSARPDLRAFVLARCLRIFPAVCVCVALSVFVWGPCLTTLSAAKYFSNLTTYKYLINNTALLWRGYITEALPGVFMGNPFPRAFNGSIWTLPIELRMYLLVAGMGVIGLLRRRFILSVLLLLSALIICVECQRHILKEPTWDLPGFFLAGALFYLNRDWIPASALLLAILSFVAFAAFQFARILFPAVGAAFLVYAVFWFAYVPNGGIRKFNQLGDYSYGLYIYSFPVQQTLIFYFPGIKSWPVFIASFPLTLFLAILSWHLIEKRALALKHWKPNEPTKKKGTDCLLIQAQCQ